MQGGGPGNVQLALDLLQFDAALRPAMAWVWGSTLVCRDLDTAKRVTFHPSVRRRTVTLDGDVFDPSGTLSGGARLKVSPVRPLRPRTAARSDRGSACRGAPCSCSCKNSRSSKRNTRR